MYGFLKNTHRDPYICTVSHIFKTFSKCHHTMFFTKHYVWEIESHWYVAPINYFYCWIVWVAFYRYKISQSIYQSFCKWTGCFQFFTIFTNVGCASLVSYLFSLSAFNAFDFGVLQFYFAALRYGFLLSFLLRIHYVSGIKGIHVIYQFWKFLNFCFFKDCLFPILCIIFFWNFFSKYVRTSNHICSNYLLLC